MLIRDVIEATAMAGEVRTVDLIGQDASHGMVRLRQLGMLVSYLATDKSWATIAQAWNGRHPREVRRGARKAEARLYERDPEAVDLLRQIRGFLGISAETLTRSATAPYTPKPSTLDRRIAAAEARLATLRAQRACLSPNAEAVH